MCRTANLEEANCTTALPAIKDRTRPLFSLGQVVATPGVLKLCEENDISPIEYLARHQCGQWGGELPAEDKKSNDEALVHGGRLFSTYMVKGTKVWIITEWDRSVTTLLLPSEY